MLPSPDPTRLRITDVLPSCYAAVGVPGSPNPLEVPTAPAVVVVLIDGLGMVNLSNTLGHAPFLRRHVPESQILQATFPSTTATALASLTTGEKPGAHGILGYVLRNPADGEMVNQLSGLERVANIDSWLARPTLSARHEAEGIRSAVVGLPRFVDSGLTRVVHQGMDYFGANDLGQRCRMATRLIREDFQVVILYIPELDQIGHADGCESDAWRVQLEIIDWELRKFRESLPREIPVLVTADHGMVDVDARHHVNLGTECGSLSGVAALGGEPRGVQLFLERPDEAVDIAAAWNDALDGLGMAVTRSDVISSGWWATGQDEVLSRAGDVVLIANDDVAFYDGRVPTERGRTMRGQHGALTPTEVLVPWISLEP